jgi:hypothetical protein
MKSKQQITLDINGLRLGHHERAAFEAIVGRKFPFPAANVLNVRA